MAEACILLGSNIAPEENLRRAFELIQAEAKIKAISSTWETLPVGSTGPNFLNAAILIDTDLTLAQLKVNLLSPIEVILGRVRLPDKYAARTIDLDIIVYDGVVVDPSLWETAYVALPIAELYPQLRHPLNGQSLSTIATYLELRSGAFRRLR